MITSDMTEAGAMSRIADRVWLQRAARAAINGNTDPLKNTLHNLKNVRGEDRVIVHKVLDEIAKLVGCGSAAVLLEMVENGAKRKAESLAGGIKLHRVHGGWVAVKKPTVTVRRWAAVVGLVAAAAFFAGVTVILADITDTDLAAKLHLRGGK